MQAADLFVLGSHREGCNFSLIEALATGLLPVVTDIPSNRMLTGDGHIGELWTKGESQTLASALITAAERGGEHVRAPVLAHYRQHLSAEALGRRFTKAYAQLIQAGSPGQPALRQFPQA
jgi:glycosyltransferase involved in cell wall biosynthesis